MTFKFDIISDIHTDLWKSGVLGVNFSELQNKGSDLLIIAGDTSNYLDEVVQVVRNARKIYEHVLFVDGNHEHYMTPNYVQETMKYLRAEGESIGATFLDGENNLLVDRTLFIGVNGWYDFKIVEPEYTAAQSQRAWLMQSNDPRYVYFGPNVDAADLATKHADFLAVQVAAAQDDDAVERIVVTTHTAPRKEFVSMIHGNAAWNMLSGAYGNAEMSRVRDADVNGKIKFWAFGHTHTRSDKDLEGIRYLNNSRGYENEQATMGTAWRVVQVDLDDDFTYE